MTIFSRLGLLSVLLSLFLMTYTGHLDWSIAVAEEPQSDSHHSPTTGHSDLSPTNRPVTDKKISSQPSAADQEQAKKELEALKQKPEEFRTLVTGIQVFLGRFGYGVGPYHGQLDQQTQDALKAYQQHVGLEPTGEIDYLTLKSLTEDDKVLNRVIPYLPPYAIKDRDWDNVVEVQGSWMLKEGNTDDVRETSRITCSKSMGRCIDSTASLVNTTVPSLAVHTDIYEIKEWNEEQIVTHPYEGESCAVSILRIFRQPVMVSRFVSSLSNPATCRNVKSSDYQYLLDDGPKIYQLLKSQKAKAIREILQVKRD
jgi:hypothetical protein